MAAGVALAWLLVTGAWKWLIIGWLVLAVVVIPYSWWYGKEAWLDREWERLRRRIGR
jgi:hypothetical protein